MTKLVLLKSAARVALAGAAAMTAGAWGTAALGQTTSSAQVQFVDEIVVTARKREERLQEVPVAASAMTSEQITDIGGFTNNAQIGNYLTGVSIDPDGIPEFFVRGAGIGRAPTTDSATTQLRNGAETAGGFGGRSFTPIDMFDLAQVEVYRGPQGALYGRNAVGGVVNIVNQAPKPEFEYSLLASWDFERDERRLEGIVNIPLLADRLFFRGGVQFQEEKGLYHNEFLRERFQGNDQIGVRLALKALVSESVDSTLFVDYGKQEIPTGPRDITFGQSNYTNLGVIGADGLPVSGFHYFPISGDSFRQAFDTRALQTDELTNVNWTTNVDTPVGLLQSITQYRHRNFELTSDNDASYVGGPLVVAPCGTTSGGRAITTNKCVDSRPSDTEIFTQEFRLLSPDGAPFQWLLGADYRYLENSFNILRTGRVLAANQFLVRNSLLETESENKQIGVFANASVEVFTNLTVSAGVRYSHEEKSFKTQRTNLDPGRAAFGKLVAPPTLGDLTFNTIDPSLSLSYKMGDHLIYASWARAHRSGGFNQDDPSFANLGGGLTFDTETASSYELGAKGIFLDRALNLSAAIFFVDYNNLLYNDTVAATDPRGQGFQLNFVANGGAAEVKGAEADMSYRIHDLAAMGGDLFLNAGVAYNNTEYTETTARSAAQAGYKIAQTPTWDYRLGATYRQPISEELRLFLNTNYSSEIGGVDSVSLQNRRATVVRWDGQVGLEGNAGDHMWAFTVFVNNITDRAYDLRRDATASAKSDPRTWGVRLTIRGS